MKKVSNFSNRLKEYLVNKGLYQKQLVDKINLKGGKITPPQLTMYLQNKNTPREELFQIFVNTMEVSELWLLGYDLSKEDEQMLDLFQTLDNENKDAVIDLIKAIIKEKAQKN